MGLSFKKLPQSFDSEVVPIVEVYRFASQNCRWARQKIAGILCVCQDFLTQTVCQKNEADWRIGPNTSDIYSEIDRVLADVNGRVAETKQGICRLFGILYECGYGEKYKSYLDSEVKLEPSHIAQWVASGEQEMKQLKQSAMQQIVEKPLQAPVLL